jgi:hypothetical protein
MFSYIFISSLFICHPPYPFIPIPTLPPGLISFSIQSVAIKRKRALSEEELEDPLLRIKRAKIVTIAPPSTGKPDVYEYLQQDPAEKTFDDRPEPDVNIPSVALLYQGFGHFLDIMDGRNDVPGLADIDIMKLHKEVDGFASKMNMSYDDEKVRRDAALPCLNSIFSAHRGIKIPPLTAAAIGATRSDGYNTASHCAATMVAELKNKIVGISSIPQVELACYVARLNVVGMKAHPQLFQQWRVPCLGLTIVGELNIFMLLKI